MGRVELRATVVVRMRVLISRKEIARTIAKAELALPDGFALTLDVVIVAEEWGEVVKGFRLRKWILICDRPRL